MAGENYVSMFIASNGSNCLTQLNPIKMIMCWIPNNLQVHFSTRLDYGFKLTPPPKNFSEKLIGFWVKNWSVLWLKIFVKNKLSPVKLQPLANQELLKALFLTKIFNQRMLQFNTHYEPWLLFFFGYKLHLHLPVTGTFCQDKHFMHLPICVLSVFTQ